MGPSVARMGLEAWMENGLKEGEGDDGKKQLIETLTLS